MISSNNILAGSMTDTLNVANYCITYANIWFDNPYRHKNDAESCSDDDSYFNINVNNCHLPPDTLFTVVNQIPTVSLKISLKILSLRNLPERIFLLCSKRQVKIMFSLYCLLLSSEVWPATSRYVWTILREMIFASTKATDSVGTIVRKMRSDHTVVGLEEAFIAGISI